MVTVGIRELKAQLSAYIRKARSGQTVVVTDHGEVVAELRAPGAAGDRGASAERQYREAVASGALRLPTNPGDRSWLDVRGRGLPRGTAAALLDAERGDT